ncbi:MAG TPA: DUF1707 domain-containing protein [Actinopolymorphaceae bacterium]|jgi:hypothetical protein
MTDERLRIGDAERDQALRMLGEHHAAGRLDLNEFQEQSSRILAARTWGELKEIFADLPEPHPRPVSDAALERRADSAAPAKKESAAPSRRRGEAVWRFAAGLSTFVWIASIAVIMMTGVDWWWILVPIGYSCVLGAWASATGIKEGSRRKAIARDAEAGEEESR